MIRKNHTDSKQRVRFKKHVRRKSSPRLLYNQDSTNIFVITREPIISSHLEHMIDEVVDAGVEAFLICPNAQKTSYPSEFWETMWNGYSPDSPNFFGSIPQEEISCRRHWIEQMIHLVENGCDYLGYLVMYCHKRHISPWVTIRMNDMHDALWEDSHLHSSLWLEHPEYRLPSYCGFNYAFPQVRRHYLSLIKEIIRRYDIEGVELDYLRFPYYFPKGKEENYLPIMTKFVAHVRKLLNSKENAVGHSIILSVRVPPTLAACRELGLDVIKWSESDLIDAVTLGHFLHTAWEIPFDEFRVCLKPEIALYGATEYLSQGKRDPDRPLVTSPEMLRGLASGFLAGGANGINLFNFFCAREVGKEPNFNVLNDLKSLGTLRGKDKLYMISSGGSDLRVDLPLQVPIKISTFTSREFRLLMAKEDEYDQEMKAILQLILKKKVKPSSLFVRFNNIAVRSGIGLTQKTIFPEPDYARPKDEFAVTFDIPVGVIMDGWNKVVVRNEGDEVEIIGLEIGVKKIQ